MNEDGNMNITADTANKASELRPDIDLNDPKLGLKIAAERLSIVRYVFLVQIEDGIASAASVRRSNTRTPCSSVGPRPIRPKSRTSTMPSSRSCANTWSSWKATSANTARWSTTVTLTA